MRHVRDNHNGPTGVFVVRAKETVVVIVGILNDSQTAVVCGCVNKMQRPCC